MNRHKRPRDRVPPTQLGKQIAASSPDKTPRKKSTAYRRRTKKQANLLAIIASAQRRSPKVLTLGLVVLGEWVSFRYVVAGQKMVDGSKVFGCRRALGMIGHPA